ncbi:MAG: HD-GYP domain-containing protein [Planctomycetota bacterium]|jgi:HD-GYP domain-containing protein (c-di-GMP phosphodiesterase class II)
MPVAKKSSTKTVTALIDELVSALLGTDVHHSNHPQVQETVDSVQHQLLDLTHQLGQDSLCLAVLDDLLVFQDKPLLSASLSASRLIRSLGNLGASGIELHAGATKEHISSLLEALAGPRTTGKDFRSVNAILSGQGCVDIKLHDPVSLGDKDVATEAIASTLGPAAKTYQTGIAILQDMVVDIGLGRRISLDLVRNHAERMYELMQTKDGPLMNLASYEQDDAFTLGHSVRVAVLAMNLACTMTEDVETIVRLGNAAMLHDVGKALIPLELVLSRSPLDEAELLEVQKHAELGGEMLMDQGADPLAVTVAFGHHRMRHEGGYPATRHKYMPSTGTEIVKICDVYEALTANRPYRPRMSPPDAYRVILGMKGHFDQHLLRCFIQVTGLFPAGQILQLKSGELAKVIKQSKSLDEPVVEILTSPGGDQLNNEDRETIDLSTPTTDEVRKVEGVVDLPEVADDPSFNL